MRLRIVLFAGVIAAVGSLAGTVKFTDHGEAFAGYIFAKARGGYSLGERLVLLSAVVEKPLRQDFMGADVPFPPEEISLLAFKDERRIEVYARSGSAETWRYIKTVPIVGLSGQLGPKLREGDLQVPEGLYRAEFLNPNGRFHVSIRLNYPNGFDRRKALLDGRTKLGGDIMIHGTASSVGCLAVGNRAAEELFFLAGLVSKEKVRIIVSPTDFRSGHRPVLASGQPVWLSDLYAEIQRELSSYPTGPIRSAGASR